MRSESVMMRKDLSNNLEHYLRRLQHLSHKLTNNRPDHPFKVKRDMRALAMKSPRTFLAFCALTRLFRQNIAALLEPSYVAIVQVPPNWKLFDVREAAKILIKDEKLGCCMHPDKKDRRGWDFDASELLEFRRLIVLVHEGTVVHEDFQLAATISGSLHPYEDRYLKALGVLRKCGEVSPDQVEVIARQPSERLDAIYRIGQPASRAATKLSLERVERPALAPTVHIDISKGFGDASVWADEIKTDLQDWRNGILPWSEVDKGCLLYGPPGTGKTRFAAALAAASNLNLEVGSVTQWQSSGDGALGDMLKAMYKSFSAAKESAPSLLFIDEIDSIGDRSKFTTRHASYSTQVVNGLLECLDGIEGREGVVVIGASNNPEKLDDALLRSGRLERHIHFPLPDAKSRAEILSFYLPSLSTEPSLTEIAARMPGKTGADLERVAREARRIARREKRPVSLGDVRSRVLVPSPLSAEAQHRVAIHEAGHAVMAYALQLGKIDLVEIYDNIETFATIRNATGITVIDNPPREYTTKWETLKMIAMHLGGAAAEDMIFGHRSNWSAGTMDSDLACATNLALRMLTQQGFGNSLYFLPNSVDLTSPSELWKELELRDEVNQILAEQYQRAREVLDGLRRSVVILAEVLMKEKRLNAAQLEQYLPTGPKKKASSRPH